MDNPENETLLKLVTDTVSGLDIRNKSISITMKDSDLKFGNWKRAKAVLK